MYSRPHQTRKGVLLCDTWCQEVDDRRGHYVATVYRLNVKVQERKCPTNLESGSLRYATPHEVERVKSERFGAGTFVQRVTPVGEALSSKESDGWGGGMQAVANGELFGLGQAVAVECREEETDFLICTDSMVTTHLLRKGLMRPWLLNGHEHEATKVYSSSFVFRQVMLLASIKLR